MFTGRVINAKTVVSSCSREGLSVLKLWWARVHGKSCRCFTRVHGKGCQCFISYKTPAVLLIVKTINERQNLHNRTNLIDT